jgi:hypothetical protein
MTNINPLANTALPGTAITPADIVKFKLACVRYYGTAPSDAEAIMLLEQLVIQMQNIYRPITDTQNNKYEGRQDV